MAADLLTTLKQTLIRLRGLHLRVREAMLAAQHVVQSTSADDARFDDLAAIAHGLAEVNAAMVLQQTELIDRIHAAEQAVSQLH